MIRSSAITLAAITPSAIGQSCAKRLAWTATWIAGTNASSFTTTTAKRAERGFHVYNRSVETVVDTTSSTVACTTNGKHTRSISAIAQRLPSEAETRTSRRFREFEVCFHTRESQKNVY